MELHAINALRHRHEKKTMTLVDTIPADEAALLAKPETKAVSATYDHALKSPHTRQRLS